MAGHSHWAKIKRAKGANDAKRGKIWSKIARKIIIAAKNGGDPRDNLSLRYVIDEGKAVNMPKDTIEKAIKKGTGELEGESYEEITYEGYGPEGVAVMCKVLTDNRNRTAPEIKKLFERSGGNLGTPNCVAWMFQAKGVITVAADAVAEDRIMDLALDAGAEDVDRAVLAARRAFDEGPWPRLDPLARGRLLFRLAERIRANLDDLALTDTLNGLWVARIAASRVMSVVIAVLCLVLAAGGLARVSVAPGPVVSVMVIAVLIATYRVARRHGTSAQ